MNFKESLQILGIEKYQERIFNSNSHGELFHLIDYIALAGILKDKKDFSEWFEITVEYAEKNWKRPESVFQHIPKLLKEFIIKQLKT